MEQLQLDLNLVKKEPHYFEDYGQSSGNILDNIIPEPDFDPFGQGASNVPNEDDMDQGVDWLNSFFDEPPHDTCNINALNPPISKLSDVPLSMGNVYPSVVKLLGQNMQGGSLVESLNLISDDYAGEVYKTPISTGTPSPDPFLAPADEVKQRIQTKLLADVTIPDILKKAQNFKVLTQLDRNSLSLATARELIQRLKSESEDNAHRVPDHKIGRTNASEKNRNIRSCASNFRRESDSNGNDSGYDSPRQPSPGCASLSPTRFLGDKDGGMSSADNTPTSEKPLERQPFYLSEEERRTLITEGLPVPVGYPLSKVEERALKKVRRKIKNKISAQESRRKKKEYMEALEKKIDVLNGDNTDLKKKLDALENSNKSLLTQLHKLQSVVAARATRQLTTRSSQTEIPSK
ncbi:uncharacterized protein LOC135682341 isoform X2 [Rhopilema esculentum]|uniref:uncharacterized protein LOC135682341 isoform X2 n=1 Tax=Rhopilema esculentum TaxID=499914 RepID=UPI0031DF8583